MNEPLQNAELIQNLKSNKAPGVDEGGNALIERMLELILKI